MFLFILITMVFPHVNLEVRAFTPCENVPLNILIILLKRRTVETHELFSGSFYKREPITFHIVIEIIGCDKKNIIFFLLRAFISYLIAGMRDK